MRLEACFFLIMITTGSCLINFSDFPIACFPALTILFMIGEPGFATPVKKCVILNLAGALYGFLTPISGGASEEAGLAVIPLGGPDGLVFSAPEAFWRAALTLAESFSVASWSGSATCSEMISFCLTAWTFSAFGAAAFFAFG